MILLFELGSGYPEKHLIITYLVCLCQPLLPFGSFPCELRVRPLLARVQP
jgi:hypothetical protein